MKKSTSAAEVDFLVITNTIKCDAGASFIHCLRKCRHAVGALIGWAKANMPAILKDRAARSTLAS